jgi:ammonium transporter, Amt family
MPPGHDGAARGSLPAVFSGKAWLITEFLDAVDREELKQALLDAGAKSIVASGSYVYTGQQESQVIRGYRSKHLFSERLRVEVLVPGEQVTAALNVFRRFSPEKRSTFIQAAETPDGVSE